MEMIQQWYSDHSNTIINYAIAFAVAVVIYWVGSKIANVISKGIGKLMEKRKLDPIIVSFVQSLSYGLMMAFVIIAALSQLGVQTASFIAIIGAAGLAVGLALQGSLSNFAAGVLIIAFRPFKSGDFIEAAGESGIVESIKLFSTIIRSVDNKEIILPNSAIVGSAIINYSARETRRVDIVVGVSYDADIKHAKQVLTEIVAAHKLVLKDEEATIAVSELADSSVNFVVRPWAKTEDYWTVYFDLMETIKIRLDEENIGIPYPQMDVHIQNQANAEK
ncbi:mechanosensitive ion channel family protein [Psychrobium sp. 1_MG-2023]|uniref:mechanosensitive ion channel family protein n=1 Tax=Psychrobium sp. 1_MG-2023 TaxID=3062624 RepID=UPI000C32581C|nr:mechanosensitive ion channel domain-containing protein [Psychrobium sp. 1_MG-2023]MDP2560058.1 mechanosensitive ion channel [Psychrobium sp. 1_MG-2023]PKF56281.1 mechanosensitive ion channel protein [Alteromonadales bacterium alter-6D02]